MINALRSRFARSAPSLQPRGAVPADDDPVNLSLAGLIGLSGATEGLDLRPRRAHARRSGGYASAFKGRGMEFDEVRAYMAGDDVRSLDWRVMARTGRPHTKLFREERERPVVLLLDQRSGMRFATRGAFKSVRAGQLAALLGWTAIRSGDRIGALLFNDLHHQELRPQRGHRPLLALLERIVHNDVAAPADRASPAPLTLADSLMRLQRVAQPGSLLAIISDLQDFDGRCESLLAQLARHNELIVCAIHDPLEADLPRGGLFRISDGQRELRFDGDDNALQERYHNQFSQRMARVQGLCRRLRLHWLPLSTGDAPAQALRRLLGVAA
jgi:uncharacterized protein (DUF58 family)